MTGYLLRRTGHQDRLHRRGGPVSGVLRRPRQPHGLVSVVLGCEEVKTETGGTRVESFSETARLFDWGFDNFSTRTVLESNELICEVPVA